MFYRIKNNKLFDYADYKYLDECQETDIINAKELDLHPEKVIVQNGVLVLNPNYEEEAAAKREAAFNKEFFLTSLGYVRRSVTMKDGGKKDFLTAMLPAITSGVNAGLTVKVFTYDKPTFEKDVEDWTKYQHTVEANTLFIGECLQQLQTDFGVINQGV